jgi:phosphoenolpyruvate phosphomutase
MTDFLRVAENMVDACSIPVIADCDTGFGGPANVSHAVKKYEKAGIAGISIEDKIFPKQNSLLENSKQELLSEKDFVAKIIAARESKKDKNFMIIARTEALIAEKGMNEAIKRARAYENAGADAILIHSKKSTPDEIFEFSEQWNGNVPLVVVPTSYPSVKLNDLISHKIKIVIYANQSLRAAHKIISEVLKEIIQKQSLDEVKMDMSSMNDIFELQEMYKINDQEKIIESSLKKMGYIN